MEALSQLSYQPELHHHLRAGLEPETRLVYLTARCGGVSDR